MSSNLWITEVETIKWQTRAAYAIWLQVKVCGCGLGLPIGCMLALSVTQKRRCSCSMQLVVLHKCYVPLPLKVSMAICFQEYLPIVSILQTGIHIAKWHSWRPVNIICAATHVIALLISYTPVMLRIISSLEVYHSWHSCFCSSLVKDLGLFLQLGLLYCSIWHINILFL